MDIGELRELVAQQSASAQALAALGLALDARVNGVALGDEVAARTGAVLAALGADAVVGRAAPADLAPLLAGIRADLLYGGRLLSEPCAGRWWPAEGRLHQAFGDVSAGFATLLHERIAPRLTGLAARLAAPGAAFLDIGTGAGALAIAMARRWPQLSVVGIDPLPGVIALARNNAEAAGYGHRIELRVGKGEELAEAGAFDLAFVPSAFIPERSITAVVARAADALRPGGWVLMATIAPDLAALPAALVRFRVATWGGTIFSDGAAEALLEACGLTEAQPIAGRTGAPFGFAAGRRSRVIPIRADSSGSPG